MNKPENPQSVSPISGKTIAESLSYYLHFIVLFLFCYFLATLSFLYSYLSSIGIPPKLNYLYIPVLGYFFSSGLFLLCKRAFYDVVEKNLREETFKPGESKQERVFRLCNDINSMIYYTISFSLGVYATYGTEYLPRIFFGKLDLSDFHLRYPMENPSYLIFFYFLMNLGHNFERLFELWTHRKSNGTFWLMNFHHVITIVLMTISFYGGNLLYGVSTLLIHDFIEPFFNISKLCREIKPLQQVLTPTLILFILTWLLTRAFAFSFEIMRYLHLLNLVREDYFWNTFVIVVLEDFCMCTLWVMNQFWTVQILKIVYKKLRFNSEETPSDKKN